MTEESLYTHFSFIGIYSFLHQNHGALGHQCIISAHNDTEFTKINASILLLKCKTGKAGSMMTV